MSGSKDKHVPDGHKASANKWDESRALCSALQKDGAEVALWGRLHKALVAAGAKGKDVMPIVMGRNVDAAVQFIDVLAGDVQMDATADEPPSPADQEPISPTTKREAMKAFRRRMKLTRLDHESRLGVGPLTGGKAADFESILPPREFPEAVWKALASDGQLVSTGRGFYKLP